MDRGALFFFCRPLAKGHLFTTRKRVVVLPTAAVRSPRAAPPDVISLPSITDQETPLAACASDGDAPITGGLEAIGHQQAVPGIYRCIARHY